MLDTKTSILTPSQFVELGDLRVGDIVYDEKGKECEVKSIYDGLPEVFYKMQFDDSYSLESSAEQLWNTWQHRDRKAYLRSVKTESKTEMPYNWVQWKGVDRYGRATGTGPSVKSTQSIIDTLTHSKRGDNNHSIPITKTVQFEEKELPIDPYIIGYWIGDGSTGLSTFTCGEEDREGLVNALQEAGYPLGKNKHYQTVGCLGLIADLKLLSKDLALEKEIPIEYLTGSFTQRLEFLRGMMDSDGFMDKSTGMAEFVSKRKDHADVVMSVVHSLGYKPRMYEGDSMFNGKNYGTKYRVYFRPIKTINPFRLERKSLLVRDSGNQAFRHTHRIIRNVEKVDPKPARSIVVSSESGLFLAGHNLVPVNGHTQEALCQ